MQVVVDIALISASVATIATLGAAVTWGFKTYRSFNDAMDKTKENEERINQLQENQNNCPMKSFDLEKFAEIVDGLQKSSDEYRNNMINDFEAIKDMKRCQKVELQAILTLFKHVRDGNHVDEIQKSFDKLVDELVTVNNT